MSKLIAALVSHKIHRGHHVPFFLFVNDPNMIIHPDLRSAPSLQVFVFGGYEAEMAHIDRWDTENLTWDTLELPLELQGVCFAAVAVS